jgi:hypothetical protein
MQSSEPQPVIIITRTPLHVTYLVSEIGGSDHIGFISRDYDRKYVIIWCQ